MCDMGDGPSFVHIRIFPTGTRTHLIFSSLLWEVRDLFEFNGHVLRQ